MSPESSNRHEQWKGFGGKLLPVNVLIPFFLTWLFVGNVSVWLRHPIQELGRVSPVSEVAQPRRPCGPSSLGGGALHGGGGGGGLGVAQEVITGSGVLHGNGCNGRERNGKSATKEAILGKESRSACLQVALLLLLA